jgi:hypothetical protein
VRLGRCVSALVADVIIMCVFEQERNMEKSENGGRKKKRKDGSAGERERERMRKGIMKREREREREIKRARS